MTSLSLTPLSTLLAARGESADFPLQALLDLAGIGRIQQGQLNVQGMYTSFRGRRSLHLSADLQGHERLLVVAQLLLVSQRLDLVESADEPLMVMVDPRLADPALEELLAQAPRLLFPAAALASSLRGALGHLPLDWIEQALDDPQFRTELIKVWSSESMPEAPHALAPELTVDSVKAQFAQAVDEQVEPESGLDAGQEPGPDVEEQAAVDEQAAAAEALDAALSESSPSDAIGSSESLSTSDSTADPVERADASALTAPLPSAERELSAPSAPAPEPTSRRRRS